MKEKVDQRPSHQLREKNKIRNCLMSPIAVEVAKNRHYLIIVLVEVSRGRGIRSKNIMLADL